MRIAICDDEKVFRDEITEAILSFFGKLDTECIAYEDGLDLVFAYEMGVVFDAIFLDIEMQKLDGLKAAAVLRDMGVNIPIIFLTSHTEFAMEGYEVYAFRFLAKPMNQEKVNKTLFDLKEELFSKRKLMIKCEGEDIPLLVDDIIYVEAMNNSISIIMSDDIYCIRKKLGEMERELNVLSDTFFKIHRGYIVNLSKVKRHHGSEVVMSNDSSLPISRASAKEFKKKLFEYVKKQAR